MNPTILSILIVIFTIFSPFGGYYFYRKLYPSKLKDILKVFLISLCFLSTSFFIKGIYVCICLDKGLTLFSHIFMLTGIFISIYAAREFYKYSMALSFKPKRRGKGK